jgi:hypothetical protein
MARRLADSYGGDLADHATFYGASKMTLNRYYQKPPWRRALCHFIPFAIAAVIGAIAIMAMDREFPLIIVWGKVVPPIVEPGQDVTFHYSAIKDSEYGGNVVRWIVDSKGVVFHLADTPTYGDRLKLNVEGEVVKDFPVPCGIGVGSATYHSETALYKNWNLVQWLFPVKRHLEYPFVVKQGQHNAACGFNVGSGVPGIQGLKGEPGATGATGPAVVRPRTIHKVWIEPTVLTPGGKFVVHIDLTMGQLCPGETHWSLVRVSDGVEVSKVIQPTVPTKLGTNHIENTRVLPNTVPPGEYYYAATIYDFCGPDRTTFMSATEHIPLTIK